MAPSCSCFASVSPSGSQPSNSFFGRWVGEVTAEMQVAEKQDVRLALTVCVWGGGWMVQDLPDVVPALSLHPVALSLQSYSRELAHLPPLCPGAAPGCHLHLRGCHWLSLSLSWQARGRSRRVWPWAQALHSLKCRTKDDVI